MSKAKLFRDALKRGMVTAPGCFDCIMPLPGPGPRNIVPGWLVGHGGMGGPFRGPTGSSNGATHLYAFDLDGLDTKVGDGDAISILPAVAGG